MIMLNKDDLPVLTQSVLAVVIVVGCGLTLFFKPDLSDKIIPVLTFVVTFYFAQGAVQRGVVLGQQQQQQIASSAANAVAAHEARKQ